MKNLVFILFLMFVCHCLHGQNSNNISTGGLYSNLSGLNGELSYDKLLTTKIGFKGRFAHNFKKSYGIRSGLFYRLIDYKSFDLDFGVEFNFERHKSGDFNNKISSTNVEFPLTVSYSINDKFGLFGETSSSVNLNDTESNRLIDNLRLGLKYRW